jgi:hypothetical protein
VQSDVYKEAEAQIQMLIAGKSSVKEVTAAIQKVQDEAIARK